MWLKEGIHSLKQTSSEWLMAVKELKTVWWQLRIPPTNSMWIPITYSHIYPELSDRDCNQMDLSLQSSIIYNSSFPCLCSNFEPPGRQKGRRWIWIAFYDCSKTNHASYSISFGNCRLSFGIGDKTLKGQRDKPYTGRNKTKKRKKNQRVDNN